MEKFEPITAYPHILHGGDYNPEQWMEHPEIIEEDMRMMKLAGCNVMSIGIFAWATLEQEEGKYDFSFLDFIMDKLNENGIKAILATPSGARPAWMAQKYTEVLRVNEWREKQLFGVRHNHCFTSPIYRQKVAEINRRLAERYKNHPALLMWHVSNEYGGECHCPLCQQAFRKWLKEKYHNDLSELNYQWWTKFWSHTYTDWEQIESPSPIGEHNLHGLVLDWKRFVTYQTGDFIDNEIAPLREITPNIPVTTNFMWVYDGLDYFKLKDKVDVVSWDNYPEWHHSEGCVAAAQLSAIGHDIYRSLKHQPFMLMESTPSLTNWKPINKLKRPGMHILSSLQAVAHGSNTVQYFQWRKSRGSSEKFHGAVVDHCGHENTRVFREVARVGELLKKLDGVIGTPTAAQAAIVYDMENHWALDAAECLELENKRYLETIMRYYAPFWSHGVNTDVIDSEEDFSKYKLIIAPLLYMIKPRVAEKIERFVADGGTFVTGYFSGVVNENDLCFLGGTPCGKLKEVFGIWAEEVDTLYPEETNWIITNGKRYAAKHVCELLHVNTAQVLGRYDSDFYKGMPAVTVNPFGKGEAYYIAFCDDGAYSSDFVSDLIAKLKLTKALDAKLPEGVTAHTREGDGQKFIFVENYNGKPVNVELGDKEYIDILGDGTVTESLDLDAYGVRVLAESSK